MTADIATARTTFGAIEVIGRQFVSIPGSTQTVEYRALSPDGPYSGPMLALVRGRYPSGAGQVAVTSGVAQDLQARTGSVLSLPGHHQRVTGIVENPSDLNDQFALVPPSAAGPPSEPPARPGVPLPPPPPAPLPCWARCSDPAQPTWRWPPDTAATSAC